jgi:hypothetical protein
MVEHGLTATPNPSDIPPSQVLEAELKDIRRKKKQDRTRKLEQALIESRIPESSPARRRNPEGWQQIPVPGYVERGGTELYKGHGTKAMLQRDDEVVTAQVQDPKTGRWHYIEDDIEQSEMFDDRQSALKAAAAVAKLFREAKVDQEPRYTEEWLRWFAAQKPNQADYVRLFWDNDGNGAYDINLTSSVKESRELFEEIFEEYL